MAVSVEAVGPVTLNTEAELQLRSDQLPLPPPQV